MTSVSRRGGAIAVFCSMLVVGGCGTRVDLAPKTVAGVTYGVTREPFHDRWWQYCERGVSWANGGFWTQAESDLRQCLALRQTDARRARTYGMHFVQCFAYRELGAVLLELGRLAEAEAELTLSLAQEPSAKAEFLLRRLHQQRAPQAPVAARLVVIDPTAPRAAAVAAGAVAAAAPVPPPIAPPDLTAVDSRIVIEGLTAAGDTTTVQGRLDAPDGTPLWLVPATGEPTPIPLAAHGAFAVAVPTGGALASGGGLTTEGSARPLQLIMTVEPPAALPTLTLDGPSDGARVQSTPAWFRFRADAPAGLRSLLVSDATGMRRGGLDLSGRQSGGMVAVTLTPGVNELHCVLMAVDGSTVTVTRQLMLVAAPAQQVPWRAPALLVALQPSGMGQAIRARDPAFYERSVVHDERFNLVAPEGAALQHQEVAWAQAGLVTPTTAVRAGRAVQARYVLLGTVTRGRDDAECYVRLVNCSTGQVVVTADAYDHAGDDFSTQAFFTALAARLRQAFPVHQSRLTSQGGRQVLCLGTEDGVSELLRFHVLGDDPQVDAGVIEVVSCRAHDSDFRWITPPSPQVPGLVISE
ncbi:MAG TPA: hypothetical protein VHX44_05435 [Planctomycetota bacterium]|nr:hypothetical protein [Planctomycetota bacterium]